MANSMNIISSTLGFDASTWPLHDLVFGDRANASYAHSSDAAFMFILYVSILSFILVMGATVYFVVKYRRIPGKPAELSPHHNSRLEVTWTVIPTIVFVAMFIVGFKGYTDMLVPKQGGIEADLIAAKWSWTVKYSNGMSNTAVMPSNKFLAQPVPVYYMPAETPVRLKMISKDVMHSFWVPDFRLKIDVLPNRYTKFWFETGSIPEKADTLEFDPASPWAPLNGTPYVDHWVFCAEYCGDLHSEMGAIIRVIPKDKFQWWLANAGSADPPDIRGERLWQNNCISCHSIDGSLKTGPSWKNIWGATHTMTDGSKIVVDENYLREAILNPNAKIVAGYAAGQMPSFAGVLNEQQIADLIAFMKSSKVTQPAAEKPAQ